MSQAEFRNMENKARIKSRPQAKQNMKLSFSKLAAARDKSALSGNRMLKTAPKPHPGNKNRKGLYDQSSEYTGPGISDIAADGGGRSCGGRIVYHGDSPG